MIPGLSNLGLFSGVRPQTARSLACPYVLLAHLKDIAHGNSKRQEQLAAGKGLQFTQILYGGQRAG